MTQTFSSLRFAAALGLASLVGCTTQDMTLREKTRVVERTLRHKKADTSYTRAIVDSGYTWSRTIAAKDSTDTTTTLELTCAYGTESEPKTANLRVVERSGAQYSGTFDANSAPLGFAQNYVATECKQINRAAK